MNHQKLPQHTPLLMTPLRLAVRLAHWIADTGRLPAIREVVPRNGLPHFTILAAHHFQTARDAVWQAHALLRGDAAVLAHLWAQEHHACFWCGMVGIGRAPHGPRCAEAPTRQIPAHLRDRSAWYRRLSGVYPLNPGDV